MVGSFRLFSGSGEFKLGVRSDTYCTKKCTHILHRIPISNNTEFFFSFLSAVLPYAAVPINCCVCSFVDCWSIVIRCPVNSHTKEQIRAVSATKNYYFSRESFKMHTGNFGMRRLHRYGSSVPLFEQAQWKKGNLYANPVGYRHKCDGNDHSDRS